MIKKLTKIFTAVLLMDPVFAAPIQNPLSDVFKDLPSIINWASSYILPIASLALLGIITYAGFIKLTAAGNADKEKEAMQALTSGIVGFILILSASLVVSIIGALLGIRLLNLA
jgi:hypothetical protein